MSEKEMQNQIIRHMDYRFDQIEKLITLSLINDILPQYVDDLCENLSDDIMKRIEERGFFITKSELFSDSVCVYLRNEGKVGIKDFRELISLFSAHEQKIIIVFELEKATALQRRKFVEEKISYYIKGKELFISR